MQISNVREQKLPVFNVDMTGNFCLHAKIRGHISFGVNVTLDWMGSRPINGVRVLLYSCKVARSGTNCKTKSI